MTARRRRLPSWWGGMRIGFMRWLGAAWGMNSWRRTSRRRCSSCWRGRLTVFYPGERSCGSRRGCIRWCVSARSEHCGPRRDGGITSVPRPPKQRQCAWPMVVRGTTSIGSDRHYDEARLKQISQDAQIAWRVVYDAGRRVFGGYDIDRELFLVIGRDGTIRIVDDGPNSALFETRLRKALAEPTTQSATAPSE
jgi:hypothetical protein